MLIDQQHVSRGGTEGSQFWRPPTAPGNEEDVTEADQGPLFSVHHLH